MTSYSLVDSHKSFWCTYRLHCNSRLYGVTTQKISVKYNSLNILQEDQRVELHCILTCKEDKKSVAEFHGVVQRVSGCSVWATRSTEYLNLEAAVIILSDVSIQSRSHGNLLIRMPPTALKPANSYQLKWLKKSNWRNTLLVKWFKKSMKCWNKIGQITWLLRTTNPNVPP
jgi:hypothetical protein